MYAVWFGKGLYTKCQPWAGNSTHLRLWTVVLETVESLWSGKWHTQPLLRIKPTTHGLHVECSNHWATGMRHFPIHSLEHDNSINMSTLPSQYIVYESRYNRLTRYGLDVWVDHYDDVIMGAMASQITSLTIVYSIVYIGTDLRKHQSSASLAFVRGIHRGPVNSPHKGTITRKMFPFDDVIMHDKITVIECHVYWKQKHFPGTGYCVAGREPGDLYIIDRLQLW